MRLVLLGDADLDEGVELGAVLAAAGRAWTNASTSANRRIGVRLERGTRQSRPWRSQSGRRIASSRWTGRGVAVVYSAIERERVERPGPGGSRAFAAASSVHGAGSGDSAGAEQDRSSP